MAEQIASSICVCLFIYLHMAQDIVKQLFVGQNSYFKNFILQGCQADIVLVGT